MRVSISFAKLFADWFSLSTRCLGEEAEVFNGSDRVGFVAA